MIRTVILDLDGPVLDGMLRHYRCYADILRDAGHTPMAIEEYWKMKRAGVDRRHQLRRTGADGLYDVYLDRWLERIEEPNYLALDAVQDGAADRLAEWRASGVRLVLVTLRRNRKNLLWQLSDRGILSLFDEVLSVGSDAVDADKAEAVRGCCAGETAACLWVGDSEVDVAAARKLGIPICAVTCGVRSPEYLRGVRPDFLVASLSGVMLLEITPS